MSRQLVLLLLALPSPARAVPSPLDETAFNASVLASPAARRWLVLFYSPHCGHCHAMMPEWEALAADVASLEGVASLASVDATAEAALASRLDVNGYPTLLAFADGAVYEHGGDRTAAAMLAFVRAPGASGQRRGYLGADGVVRPARLDALLRVPRDMSELVNYATDTSPLAAALLALALMLLGALLALASAPRPGPAFLTVELPPGVAAGAPFFVEYADDGFVSRLLRRPRRTMRVVAPAGIAPGQTFFVPLIKPPAVRACDPPPRPEAKKTD